MGRSGAVAALDDDDDEADDDDGLDAALEAEAAGMAEDADVNPAF